VNNQEGKVDKNVAAIELKNEELSDCEAAINNLKGDRVKMKGNIESTLTKKQAQADLM